MISRRFFPLYSVLAALMLAPVLSFDAARHAAGAQDFMVEQSVADALKAKVEAYVSPATQDGAREALLSFYQARNYRPVWVDKSGPTRSATLVLNELSRAGDFGLDEAGFALTANSVPRTSGAWSNEQTAAAEFEISTLVLKYANEARGGRISSPETLLSSYLDRAPDLPDPAVVLADATSSAAPDALLRSYHPQHEQFRQLQAAFNKLRKDAAETEVVAVPEDGPLLKIGSRHGDVLALRKRFNVLKDGEDADLYDEAVAEAVKAFQREAGLSADGLLGKRTRGALAVRTDKDKIERLRANMEAWRWMPQALGQEYLFVNIPAFTIQLVKNGNVELTERVITGESDKQTPVFSKNLSTVVLRPQWHLPDSIKIEKLISAQRRGRRLEDMGYVIRKGRRTVKSWEINWATAKLSQYEISQPSGDGNALGDVKFLFPNKHSVYLHDTPSKSLFGASQRAFSHGCIRLRNPLTLAQMLLDDDKGAGRYDVKSLVRRGPGSNMINLDNPMPIHVAYFTAWADSDGQVSYYNDVYGHERRIKLALAGKWNAIDKGRDHLAAVDTNRLKSILPMSTSDEALAAAGLPFGTPMGITNGPATLFKPQPTYRRQRGVGDIMQNALGGGF